jgi:hypothetical protein
MFGDWLGTGMIAHRLRGYRPFEEARVFARSLKLKSWAEWRSFCKGKLVEKGTLPNDIPANPNKTYNGKGWLGMHDWLGSDPVVTYPRTYLSFEEARDFVRCLNIKSQSEWRSFCTGKIPDKGTLPKDIPSHPEDKYKDTGWQGYRNWLGTG